MNANALVRPESRPASYEQALAQFEEMLRADTTSVEPLSRSRLSTPGQRTERAIVFLHGLTNSPRQFETFSERFLARGYSVLVPRLPYHGYADRMTVDLAQLRAADLVDVTASAVDIAAGLADRVTVCGISLGGVLALWAAQQRAVASAVAIAPALALPMLPVSLGGVVVGAMGRLPNRFVWWDPRVKDKLQGPPYAYPRFSTHALAQTQRLALDLSKAARTAPPRAESVWMITNAADLAVNNAAAAAMVKHWRAAGATNVHTFEFPRRLKLFHDVVDPLQPNAQPELVHPVLEEIIADGQLPAAFS